MLFLFRSALEASFFVNFGGAGVQKSRPTLLYMVLRNVKEEEVVNRITKMAAKLHFSGDRSSILGMKVSADVTNWGTWMTTKRS